MPEFSIYSSILFIHVLSALILFATGMFAPLTLRQIRAASTWGELRAWLDFERRSTKWNPLAAFALLGTGAYLGSYGFWTMPWFYVAVASWILSTVLAVGIVQRSAVALHDDTPGPGEAAVPARLDTVRWSGAWTLANATMLANDLAMFWVMFNKPELVASVVVVLFANAVAIAVVLATATARPRQARSVQA